ncbi:TetR/AcrR family transcriptional regulator [Pleomorphomonas sp. JP5]|uniref:TetR/AcrR family transcriptional regulator n=1 Tax=Pleomorphomonas sp. JP5 TaxID=2942998 RepID=UPI002043D3F9|nr:TetR/AcrR family transcriptional regulator [Pleomorphomonas sp. JP5]MCM5558253.1 TetR/AcrR family transcriptional regulator [Pleomorphomonas sp. JP5]
MTKLRRDAEENRAVILAAADLVFASHGITVPLDLVCKQAGVGRATLYRHFPDRHHLIVALLERGLEETAAKAVELGDRQDAFFVLLRFHAERIRSRSSLVDYWRVLDRGAPEVQRVRERFHQIFSPLIFRAVEAGICRPDIQVEDVTLLVSVLGSALRGRSADEQARLSLRAFELLVEGLRPRPAVHGRPAT